MLRALLATSLLVCACDKESPKDSPASPPAAPSSTAPVPVPPAIDAAAVAPTSSAAPSATAEAPTPPKCPAGFAANPFPAYCIKVPASYSIRTSRISPTHGSVDYDTGSTTDNLMVSYDDSPMAAAAKDVEAEMKFGHDKLEKKGVLPGGNKWFQGAHDDYARIVTLIKGTGLTLKCSFAYKPKQPPPHDALGTCKSLVVPPM